MMVDYYNLKISEVIRSLKTSEKGLTQKEAEKRLKEFGYNELKKADKISALTIFINQFKNALLLLLIFAGILSLFLGEKIESIAIFAILMLNAVLGFIQEYRAEKAIEALKKISAPTAKVLRDGKQREIPAKEVVPGDIVLLEAGDIVPADSRLISVSSLQIDEASLTGESVPSKKVIESFKADTPMADQENMAFMGTLVTYGKGKSIVTATGMRTEFGKIAESLSKTEDVKTPLQLKFEKLAKQIGIVVIMLITLVFILGLLYGHIPLGKIILFSLALTVSTIPNSLPIIVTVSLSMGAKRLAKKNMLIKKLPAAESLGAATAICTDKTGTLTKNQMTVVKILSNDEVIDVTGSGYEPKGDFYLDKKKIDVKRLNVLLRTCCLCNNARLGRADGKFKIMGDPTEGALIVLARKGDMQAQYLNKNFKFVQELPFDSDRKSMSVIFKNRESKKTEAYVKGAPDILLKKCDRIITGNKIRKLTEKDKKRITRINDSFAEKALRVLAFAYKEVSDSKKYEISKTEKNLILVGLAGMIDPPRDEVKKAVEECKKAGIMVTVITGDQEITTKAIAQQIGLYTSSDITLTGKDLDGMDDKELEKKIERIRIISRALPIQKLRIVKALQKKGHIVAMTGDGVNDAPALKRADIGIAMGITGTNVAKEVSEAILVDDNFATIVNAISEGRNIYDKMIKSAKYLLSCNAGEITAVFLGIIFFPDALVLLPLMLLLMNLLTDDFPALGLGFESGEDGIMERSPRNPKENPISMKLFTSIIIFGLIMGLGTLFMFLQYKEINLSKAQTVAFTTLVMFQMFAVMSSRSLRHSLKHINPFSNMWLFGAVCLSLGIQVVVIYWTPLQAIFGTVPLMATDWLKIIGISSLGFIAMEISKFFVGKGKSINTTKA